MRKKRDTSRMKTKEKRKKREKTRKRGEKQKKGKKREQMDGDGRGSEVKEEKLSK